MDLSSPPPSPSTSFQVISCIKDELDPSSIYRGQDIGYSTVEKVDALLGHPCRRLYTTLPQFPVSFYVPGLPPPRLAGQGEGKRERNSMESARAWKNNARGQDREREREREKPTRLVLFGNLLVSHCEEFTWPPGSRFVELCNRLDSTRFDFSFQVADKSLQRVFLDARKRTIDDIIDNKRRLRARKMRAWNCFICKDNFMLARECSLMCERAGWNERRMARENCLVEFHLYLSYGTWTFRVQPARGYQILSARILVPLLDTITGKYSFSWMYKVKSSE